MKYRIPIVVILALYVVGCATMGSSYKQQTYNTLLATAQLYNVSWETFVEMYRVGQVSETDYVAGRKLAIVFYEKYQMAVDLVILYEKGQADQTLVEGALNVMLAANRALLDYLKPRIQKGVPS